MLIKPLLYLSVFYFFSNPRSSFANNYVVLLCLVYCVTGIAYALTILLELGPSQLCSVLFPVVLTLISTQLNASSFVKGLASFCYTKWALEAFVTANSERLSKQRMREAKTQVVDYLILLIAGACLGSLTKASDATFGFSAYTYTIIAVSLLCKIAALRSFSQDKLQYWRESASGISSLAHFVSKDTVDLFNTLIKPVVYLSMFYFFSNPRSSFANNYIVLLCLVYCVTGIAYALAILLEPGPSQLCSVLFPVVLTLISTQLNANSFVKGLANFCYTKWALEAFVTANSERYYGVWLLTRCGALLRYGYNVNRWGLCLGLLILAGVASRAVAFIGMVTLQKK